MLILAVFAVLIVGTGLSTYVATRAWRYRPARYFVILVIAQMVSNIGTFFKFQSGDTQMAYSSHTVATLALGVFQTAQVLLIASLFVPQWWQGARPIRRIALPYLIALAALAVDLVARTGLLVDGGTVIDGDYTFTLVRPAGTVLIALFGVGWMVELAILGVSFARQPQNRPLIAMIFLSIIAVMGLMRLPVAVKLVGVLYTTPSLLVFTYAVLRTQLLVPTQAALDMALEAMSEAVAVLDADGKIVYVNPQAETLGLRRGQPLAASLVGAGADSGEVAQVAGPAALRASAEYTHRLALGSRWIEITLTPVADARHRQRGLLLLGRDITATLSHTAELERERALLDATVRMLKAEQQERSHLAETVQALSLPLIPVLEGVLVLPLIGEFDAARADQFMSVLLTGIERERARLVLIDLTGMPMLDPESADTILNGVSAASLLGARCVLVGVRPEIAETLVTSGTQLVAMKTAATLQQALQSQMRGPSARWS